MNYWVGRLAGILFCVAVATAQVVLDRYVVELSEEPLGAAVRTKGKAALADRHRAILAEQARVKGAIAAQRIRSEFLFAWLMQIETIARHNDAGVVHLDGFDDALTYLSGQTIYNLFADRSIRGPYRLPWDNACAFREKVLKPVAGLMRSYEKDANLKIPPEAKKLLEHRGLTIEP